jgi:hypothetical protein
MNKRTDTFAQPGRAHGCTFNTSCASVASAASCDGVVTSCVGSTAYYYVALVISTSIQDYHWYHWHSTGGDNFWGHKPGQTEARNWDNSGRTISPANNLNPQNCNRKPYDVFCGYYFAPKDAKIS